MFVSRSAILLRVYVQINSTEVPVMKTICRPPVALSKCPAPSPSWPLTVVGSACGVRAPPVLARGLTCVDVEDWNAPPDSLLGTPRSVVEKSDPSVSWKL